jgi:hypothetical protein
MGEQKKEKEFMLRGKNEFKTMTEFKNNLLKEKVKVQFEPDAVDCKREKGDNTNTSPPQDLRSKSRVHSF